MDAVKSEKVGDIAYDPDLVTIQQDLACVLIGIAEVRLAIELVGVGNARSEILR
jgi:hypothetical protein